MISASYNFLMIIDIDIDSFKTVIINDGISWRIQYPFWLAWLRLPFGTSFASAEHLTLKRMRSGD